MQPTGGGSARCWPEEDWKRSAPYVEVSPAELQAVVAPVWSTKRRVDVQLLRGGKSNTNLRVVSSEGASVVLRVYERDRRALARERSVLKLVEGVVPAPRMLAWGTLASGTPYAVLEWVEGRTLYEATGDDGAQARPIGRALGRALAAFETLELEEPGLLGGELAYERRFGSTAASFVDFIDWSLSKGRAGPRLGRPLAERLRRFAHDAAPRLAVCDARTNLVHGDFKSPNLLLIRAGGSWRLAAAVDWEFAMAGTSLFDLAILLRHREVMPPQLVDGVIEGFREAGGELPPDWPELTRILDLMNLCGFLNAGGHRPNVFAAARRLVEQTIEAERRS